MRRIWPALADLADADLDEAALSSAYAPDRSRPGLRVNFVTSLDGAVEVGGYSEGLSGGADRAVFGLLRAHSDGLLVGAGTLRHEGYRGVRLDERRRAWRREHGFAEYPTLVVVSSTLDLDPDQAAFADAPVRPIVLTHAAGLLERRAAPPAGAARTLADLQAIADIVVCGESTVDLAAGLAELRRRGLDQVLCEGGPHLFGALLAADLVDEFCLTISPLLAGPGAGRIVAGPGRETPLGMRLIHVIEADDMLLARYARAVRP
jgi:riboflavin biosynthesis pyrimidine reductase